MLTAKQAAFCETHCGDLLASSMGDRCTQTSLHTSLAGQRAQPWLWLLPSSRLTTAWQWGPSTNMVTATATGSTGPDGAVMHPSHSQGGYRHCCTHTSRSILAPGGLYLFLVSSTHPTGTPAITRCSSAVPGVSWWGRLAPAFPPAVLPSTNPFKHSRTPHLKPPRWT